MERKWELALEEAKRLWHIPLYLEILSQGRFSYMRG